MRKRRLPVSWSRPQTAVRTLNPVPLTPESVLFLASMKPKQWKTTGRPVETLRLGNNTGRGEHGPQNKTWDTDSYTHMGGKKVKPYTLTSSYKQRLSENPL